MQPFFQVLLSVLVIAISAQLTIPLPIIDIPITGQSLAVLVVAGLLPWQYSTLSVFIYLLLGVLGLPIFAEGTAGWEKIIGNSGGFLLGFLPAAFVLSFLVNKGKTPPTYQTFFNKNKSYWFLYLLLLMTLGTAIIVACGVLRLTYSFGFAKALEYGFYPFIWGAIIKIIVGAIIVYVWPCVEKIHEFSSLQVRKFMNFLYR